MPAGPVGSYTTDGAPSSSAGAVGSYITDGAPGSSAGSVGSYITDGAPGSSAGSVSSLTTQATFPGVGDLLAPSSPYPVYRVAVQRLAYKTVDLGATGPTVLLVVPSGRTVVVRYVIVRCTTATGVSVVAECAVTDGVPTTIISSRELTGLNASGKLYRLQVQGAGFTVGALEQVRFSVGVAATATSQIVEVDLMGYVY